MKLTFKQKMLDFKLHSTQTLRIIVSYILLIRKQNRIERRKRIKDEEIWQYRLEHGLEP